jgi:hypothetical protein
MAFNFSGFAGGAASGASAGMAAGPWGAAIGGVAGGVLGGFLGGGGNKNSLDTSAVNAALGNYLSAIQKNGKKMVVNVNNIASNLKNDVAGYSNDYSAVARREENNLVSRTDNASADYLAGILQIGDAFTGSVNSSISQLKDNTNALNAAQTADVNSLIESYATGAGSLDSKLRSESDSAISKFNEKTNAANAELKDSTFSEAARAKSEQMSLGDQFLANITRSQQAYNESLAGVTESLRSGTPSVDAALAARQALDFNQANLSRFTSVADTLSKAAAQTRSDLLATADPRAVEMSQIADNNAAAMMSGRISADVQANLARSGAFRSLNGGFGADSSMGRNLQARDLGLTSLDLMSRGDEMARNWRQLNYNTRVSGTQVDPGSIMTNNGLSTQQALAAAEANAARAQTANLAAADIGTAGALNTFNSQNNALGATYGNNLNAVGAESSQRMNTLDNIYGTQLKAADTERGQRMTLGQNLYNSNMGVLGNAMNVALANNNSIYNNNWALANTAYNSGVGVSEKLFNAGLGAGSDVFKTKVNTAGNIYSGNLNVGGNIFTGRSNAASNAASMMAGAQKDLFAATANAYGNVAGSQVGMQQQQMLNSQAQTAAQNQMWGSLINTAGSLAGSYIGSQNWNTNARGYTGLNAKTGFFDSPQTAAAAYGPGAQIARWGSDGYYNMGYK